MTKKQNFKIALTVLLLGVVVAFWIVVSREGSSTAIRWASIKESVLSGFDFKDGEYRKAISDAYCHILQLQEKITVSALDECSKEKRNQTETLYRGITGEDLGASWSALSTTEKAVAVEKVKTAADITAQTIVTMKAYGVPFSAFEKIQKEIPGQPLINVLE